MEILVLMMNSTNLLLNYHQIFIAKNKPSLRSTCPACLIFWLADAKIFLLKENINLLIFNRFFHILDRKLLNKLNQNFISFLFPTLKNKTNWLRKPRKHKNQLFWYLKTEMKFWECKTKMCLFVIKFNWIKTSHLLLFTV